MSSEDTNTVLTSTNINVFEGLGDKANYFENLYSQAVTTGFAGTRLEFLNELGLLTDSGELLPFPNANENVELAAIAEDPTIAASGGTVTGSLTIPTAKTNLSAGQVVQLEVVIGISGADANYTGGYIEIRFPNTSNLTVSLSPIPRTTSQTIVEGDTTIFRIYPPAEQLTGGNGIRAVVTYQLKGTGNWSNVVQNISAQKFAVTAIAEFHEKDGTLVTTLGTQTHSFTESENGVGGLTRMTSGQIVGYDANGDGVIDAGSSTLSF